MERANACICTALRRAAASATHEYDAALAPSGLKVTMLQPMSEIERDAGISISELARRVGLERSSMVRNVRVLERAGHVVVRPGADERSRGLELTVRGRQALARAMPLWRKAQETMARRLGEDRTALLDLLDGTRGADRGGADAPNG